MEKYNLNYIKAGMVAAIALFFSLVALDNILSYQDNLIFVQHVLSMDTTFRASAMMWRSIINPFVQKSIYIFIICWQIGTATLCWKGCLMMLKGSKKIAYLGLFFGFLLYMVGFIVIGSEWFNMWQSPTYNAQMTAGLFVSLIMLVMIFLQNTGGADK